MQKILAGAGLSSRRKAEEWIADGRVRINGQAAALGAKADPSRDTVTLDGQPVGRNAAAHVYIMLHKPEGVVTTTADPQGRPTVLDLIVKEPALRGRRLFPVGRLDYDSSGLLILTDDGELTQKLTHPRHEMQKTYTARLRGVPSKEALQRFRSGIMIEGRRTAHCGIQMLKTVSERGVAEKNRAGRGVADQPIPGKSTAKSFLKRGPDARLAPGRPTAKNRAERGADDLQARVKITLGEGRNRQIRKMCQAIGHPVLSLKRIAIGSVELGTLPRGGWRYLTAQEVDLLKK